MNSMKSHYQKSKSTSSIKNLDKELELKTTSLTEKGDEFVDDWQFLDIQMRNYRSRSKRNCNKNSSPPSKRQTFYSRRRVRQNLGVLYMEKDSWRTLGPKAQRKIINTGVSVSQSKPIS